MSFDLIRRAWDCPLPDGAAHERLVLLALADIEGADGRECFAGNAFLAQRCNLSPRSLKRALKNLASWGLIRRRRRFNSSSITTLNLPDGPSGQIGPYDQPSGQTGPYDDQRSGQIGPTLGPNRPTEPTSITVSLEQEDSLLSETEIPVPCARDENDAASDFPSAAIFADPHRIAHEFKIFRRLYVAANGPDPDPATDLPAFRRALARATPLAIQTGIRDAIDSAADLPPAAAWLDGEGWRSRCDPQG